MAVQPNRWRGAFAIFLWLALHAGGAQADSEETGKPSVPPNTAPPDTTPLVAIIMDDLGYLRAAGRRALHLPGNLSFSFIPNAPYARELADLAHQRGKEILLHIPMEARGDDTPPLGPSGLTKEMGEAELTKSVCASIESMPRARGLSNHMGSLLTARKSSMRWLMRAMRTCGDHLYFVDSQTTGGTVAASTAREHRIPTLERDIFLDHDPNPATIAARVGQLVRRAKSRGTALGLAHPYPETLKVLGRVLPRLEERGVAFVPVSALLARQMKKSPPPEDDAKDYREREVARAIDSVTE